MSEAMHTPGPPPFVKLKAGAEDVGDPNSWNGWDVEDQKTGDEKTDYLKGAEFCDLCLRKVNETESPGALTFTLTAMMQHLVSGAIKPSPMEKGFLDNLARRGAERRAQLDSN